MYKQDSNIFSLIWGRNGAAILLAISGALSGYGYVFDAEDQKAAFDVIAAIFAGVALIQVIISKSRENKKVESAKNTTSIPNK